MTAAGAPVPVAQLDLFAPRGRGIKLPDDPDARSLVLYLFAADDWRTRADIMRDLGFDDRRIRAARHEAGRIVFSCTKGFRHLLRATPKQRREAVDFFDSQALDMLATKAELIRACKELGCEILGMEEVPA